MRWIEIPQRSSGVKCSLRRLCDPHCSSIGHRFGRSGPAEGLTWAVVEFVGDPLQFFGRDMSQVNAFGEVVPQQTVRILVAAALPRRVRVTEEHA